MKSRIIILILSFSFTGVSQISDLEKTRLVERRIEFIGELAEDSDVDYTTFLEDFYYFLDHPINLNQAGFDDLRRLHLLTDIECRAILDYRTLYSKFLTIYELDAISLLNQQTVDMIKPFVFVGPTEVIKTDWKKALTKGRSELVVRYQRTVEQKDGYKAQTDSILSLNPNKTYLGDPNKYYLRYRYTYFDKLSYGLVAEKDPGEEFFRGTQKQGFDFYSAHLMIKDVGPIKKFIIGDFQANFGQGLTLWSGFNMGKSPQVLNIKQYGGGLQPYSSVNESNFYRGVSATVERNNVEVTSFVSYKSIDANIQQTDTIFDDDYVTSFHITGFHRTPTEIEKKNTINQMVVGGAVSYQWQRFKINATGVLTKFNIPLQASDLIYKQFAFSGQEHISGGLDYQYLRGNISLFGEFSTNKNFNISAVNGIIWQADSKLSIVAMHRYFDHKANNLYASNFFRTGTNENGIYIGAELKVSKRVNLSVYSDQYKSTWLKYLVDGPSTGRNLFFQANLQLNRYSSFYVRVKHRNRQRNTTESAYGSKGQDWQKVTSLRLNYSHQITTNISIKTRLEFLKYEHGIRLSNGLLMFQDIIYKAKNIPLKLYARYALFDTDDYSSRIYAYENDLLYAFSVPAYYNQGFRAYVMARYDLGDRVDLWLKWGRFTYNNQTSISNGLERIDGNHKSEVKAQIKIKF